jgi:hypothetical protein
MARSSRHPREVRERAVALVLETQADYGSQWEAIVCPPRGIADAPHAATNAGGHHRHQYSHEPALRKRLAA